MALSGEVLVKNHRMPRLTCWLATILLAAALPFGSEAKGYSSGGHSYSSHSSSSHSSSFGGGHSSSGSSHSFSSGGGHTFSSGNGSSHSSSFSGGGGNHSSGFDNGFGKSFKSGSGKSYSSGSSSSDDSRRSYTSGKSYTSGGGRTFFGDGSQDNHSSSVPSVSASQRAEPDSGSSHFSFDTGAARARREEASKQEFARFKEPQAPASGAPGAPRLDPDSASYRVRPPPLSASHRTRVYIPDAGTLSTRSVRVYNVFNPYWSRPVVVYHDPYGSFFWWWLLDRSLDDRAWWAYHHRYDMDPARYQALVASDQQLETRVEQLEAQQAPRDPSFTPAGLDRDLMYSDQYVAHTYSNRPTMLGVIAFWILAIPLALTVSGFFIWLIWFKRWQTAA
jgi:hypothetical protein